MRTNKTLIPAIDGLKYTISRLNDFSVEGYSEYPPVVWAQLETPLRDTLSFLEEGNAQEALTAISFLRSFDDEYFSLELQQCLKSFDYLEKGLRLSIAGDNEKAFLTLSDFWLKQQHFWHTNVFFSHSIPIVNRQRVLMSKRVIFRYSRTVVTYLHILLLLLAVFVAVYVVDIEPAMWISVLAAFLLSAFNIHVTSTSPSTSIAGRLGFLGVAFVEVTITDIMVLPWYFGMENKVSNLSLYIGAGFGFAAIYCIFLFSPLGWGRYAKNLGQLDLFSCYWVRSLNAKECEVIVTDGSGKIIQRRTVKHPEDVIDEVCAGAVAEMCKPGYGASGPLSRKETSVWYKYYPRISSLRYVKRRDKTSAKMIFRFFPGWFLRYRKWSPFVFTDDALLSTPGLTPESLREYFASNPSCCEPPGYEEFVALRGVEER